MCTFIKNKMGIELNWNLIVAVSIFLNALGHCEMSIYPGLRRKPLVQTVQQSLDVSPDFLSQLMEENARRKLQQQIEQQVELISYQLRRQHQRKLYERFKQRQQQKLNELSDNDSNDYIETAAKSVHFRPTNENLGYIHERPEFAVGPFDPRYYASNEETENSEDKDFSPKELEEYQEYIPLEKGENIEIKNDNAISNENKVVLAPAPGETTKLKDGTISPNFHRIKPQLSMSNANGAIVPEEGQTANDRYHHKDNNHDNIVMREHIGFKSDLGVYIVALIAGVSAAFTVGLIALGVVWVHNKTKATGDVDYPAYGVTGPIRDLSPSGDRKLAQSAQMYHYQHQKQQIIAMENQQIGEGCCALSDVDSDDDNEEGDYTVYECPGLAPTGEMEVKNPLFLDETPVTPLKNVANTQVTLQQPQTNKKESRLLSNAATNDKRPKKNKK